MSVLPRAIAALWLLGLSSAAASEPRPVPTAITAVTVYADRAQITRTGSIDLSGGTGRVAIKKLPGWIDADSVRATIVPSSAGQILDVAVETTYLAAANEEAVRVAEASVREISDTLEAISDEEKVLKDEVARLEGLRAFSIDKLPKELATRDVSVKTLADTLGFVSDTLRRDRKALRDLMMKRRELAPELAARSAKRDELQTRSQMQESAVVLDISGSGRASIVLTYLTPGAAWEPVGELRVTQGGNAVALAQYASVVQSTGEDWDGAQLTFSTQRPGEVLDVPEAQALLLGAGGAGLREVLGKMGSSFDRAQQSYAVQNEAYGKTREYWSQNMANQQEVQTRAAETFAKLADRGTTAHFNALSQRTVRADGKAVRVPIAAEEFAAKARLVCVPEATLNVVRTAQITNTGKHPILPGKVALFEDGAFVGTSELGFVAPGETFSTFLGVNDRLKVERVLDRKNSSLERGRKKTQLKVSFLITAENLSDRALDLELADHVAVAQSDDIEVSELDLPEGVKPDADGVLHWTATIRSKETTTWRISYTLEYDNDLLDRTREERQQRKSMAPAAASPRSLYDDIENLEKNFE